MGYLTADEILAADDRTYEDVPIPEWGGKVKLRSLTGREFEQYQEDIRKGRGEDRSIRFRNIQVKLIQRCAINEDGSVLFAEAQLNQLNNKSAKPIQRLFTACQKLVGMTDEDAKELAEDFEETPDDS